MVDWTKIATNVGFGAAVGAVDQIVQNKDDDRAAARATGGDELDLMSQYSTYLNYGVPLVAIIAGAMNWLPRGWDERILVSASQLAGRKLAWRYTKESKTPGYPNYTPVPATATQYRPANAALEQQRAAQLMAARAAAGMGGLPQTEPTIPVVTGSDILA
jgi:hypothetical protein